MELVIAPSRPARADSVLSRQTAATAALAGARAAFVATVVLSPFRARVLLFARDVPPVYGDYTNVLLFLSDIAVLALLACWGVSLLLRPRPLWLGPVLLRFPALALLAAAWLSVPLSIEPGLSLYYVLRLSGAAAMALFVANEVRGAKLVVPALAAMVAVQAVVGALQVWEQASVGLQALGEHSLNPESPGTSILWTAGQPKLLRAYGLSDHPNILGGLLAMAALAIGAALPGLRLPARLAVVAAFATGAGALALTFSRAAAAGFLGGVFLVFALHAYRRDAAAIRAWLVATAAAVIVAAVVVLPYADYLQARLSPSAEAPGSTEARALSERSALARNANNIFVSRPLTGVGIGTLPEAMRERYPDFEYNYQPAHFAVLDVAAETGLLGAMAYGFLALGPWILVWWHRHRLTREVAGLSGLLTATGVIGLLDYYTWSLAPGVIWFWLGLGLWSAAYRRMTEAASHA